MLQSLRLGEKQCYVWMLQTLEYLSLIQIPLLILENNRSVFI